MKKKEESRDSLEEGRESVLRRTHPHPALCRVLDGEALSPPPLWLMRQAGRYLPEYRALRQKVPGFLDLCFDPDLAAEITLQPIRRFDFDAAILFSDILVTPLALGRRVEFLQGEGPRLDPIDADGIAGLVEDRFDEILRPVFETVERVRSELDASKALIGFCGAPWTVATYMVAGMGTSDQAPARLMAAREPRLFQQLIDQLVSVSAAYLIGQLQAGADAVQIFDSWAGALDDDGFARWCIEPTRRIVDRVRESIPGAKIIGFPKGAGLRASAYAAMTGANGVGIDWTIPLAFARDELQKDVAVQGNLDPMRLVAGGSQLDAAIDRILDALSGGRLIFNLGHGIVPETPIAHVEHLVKRVRNG